MVNRILVLLENQVDLEQVATALEDLNQEVVRADHLQQAKNLIRSHEIHLVISDTGIETGGNVFDFLKWTQNDVIARHIPFVLLSCGPTQLARSLEEVVVLCARILGARAYIFMDRMHPSDFVLHIEKLLRDSTTAVRGEGQLRWPNYYSEPAYAREAS